MSETQSRGTAPSSSAAVHDAPAAHPAQEPTSEQDKERAYQERLNKMKHENDDKQRAHEQLMDKNRRDHSVRMFAGVCVAVAVFALAGYLAHLDRTDWAIGVMLFAITNTVSYVFGRRVELGDLKQLMGGMSGNRPSH